MPFPASNGSIPLTLDVAWAQARTAAASVQQQATSLATQIGAGPVSSQTILNYCSFLAALNATLTQCANVSGIVAYAQAQVGNPSLDVAGAFNTMQTALVAVITWIVTNFPKDTGNYLQAISGFTGAGVPIWVQFTQVQLSPLQTLLTALAATIN